jgi:hypothetical protein
MKFAATTRSAGITFLWACTIAVVVDASALANDIVEGVRVERNAKLLAKYPSEFSVLLTTHTIKPRNSALFEVSDKGALVHSQEFARKIAFNFDYSNHKSVGYFYSIEKPSKHSCLNKDHDILILGHQKEDMRVENTVELHNTNKHDFDVLDNGNFLFNAYEPHRASFGSSFEPKKRCIAESVVQEVDDKDNVVFEWHSLHSVPVEPNFYTDTPDRSEYAHLNSTDLNEMSGEFLFSLRGQSQLIVVSRKTGKTLYKIGGVDSDTKFLNDPRDGFCGQHQAEWTGKDTFLLYDNADNRFCLNEDSDHKHSRVVEYKLDRKAKTATLIWSYENPKWHGNFAGGAKRMKNGLTAISWGNHTKNKSEAPTVSIVTPEGEIAWEAYVRFLSKSGNSVTPVSYRANIREK